MPDDPQRPPAPFRADPTDLLLKRAERAEQGRARRESVRRSTHDEVVVADPRPDPLAILDGQNRTRIPELVPVRWGRMAQSPLAFLRGAALVMAHDLAAGPTTGLTVQACGDAHLMNFGAFATPERNEVFDLNDFDETLVGPWEWDVKRLLASGAVAVLERGGDDADAERLVGAAALAYCAHLDAYAQLPVLEMWYRQMSIERDVIPDLSARAQKHAGQLLSKMRKRTSAALMPKLTALTGEGRRIIDNPPLVTHEGVISSEHELAARFLDAYRESLSEERRVLLDRYELVDVARKVVGVGSVGTRCNIALMIAPDDEALFLQIKEASASALEVACAPYAGPAGRRVVVGQRLIQAASDTLLGWADSDTGSFYVRQLRDMKSSVDLSEVTLAGLGNYLTRCAQVLARAHARTGDAVAIDGYLGSGATFSDAVTRWALAYGHQTIADHAQLVSAIADGAIDAVDE